MAAGARSAAAEPPAAGEALVRWEPEAADGGPRVAQRWPHIHRAVAARLGFDADLGGAEVVVVRGLERLRAVARFDAPEWAAGVTVGSQRIVVRLDVPVRSKADLEATLRHECVHLLWARRAGVMRREVPLWFEEGVAEHVGGAASLDGGARIEIAAGTGRLLAFESLERAWPTGPWEADLAYQQARRWVEIVADRAGEASLGRIFTGALAPADPSDPAPAFDRALRAATGHPLSDWHADWRLALDERRGRWWLWLVEDLGSVLWALLAVGSAAAYVLVLRGRRRRQIAALPDDAAPGPPPVPPEPPGTGLPEV